MPGRAPLIHPVRRTAASAAIAFVLVAGALGVPATVASAERGGAVRCPRGTGSAVTTAFANVFSRIQPTTPDQRATSLVRGDDPAVRALLDTWLASPVGASSSVVVNAVTCRTRSRAEVDADLLLAGTPLVEAFPPGRAVREDGTWKVATSTFCTRMILEDPALAQSGVCARKAR